jgi:hypothetical protein
MNPDFEDLGVGVSYAADSSYGVYWVNNFGQGASTVVDDVVPQAVRAAKPIIEGTAKVGKKLKAKAGAWAPKGVKLTYQWYRSGKKITKATKATYTLGKADKGKRITVTVTGKKSGYTTAAKTSKATAKVR